MKSGANFVEQNRIRKLAAEGMTPEAISDGLQVPLSTVRSFMGLKDPQADADVEIEEVEED